MQTSPPRKVALLLPQYKTTNPVTAFSIMSFLNRNEMAVMLNFGDAFIAHTRNTLAEKFLATNIEWALTIDDDMVLPCGNAEWYNTMTGFGLPEKFAGLSTVERLMSHGKTLIGGLYYGRWAKGKPVYAEGAADPKEEKWVRSGPHDQVKPTKWVGTGAMLIHRSVFLDIEKTFPHLARDEKGNSGHWFTSSEHDLRESYRATMAVLNDANIPYDARVKQASEMMGTASHRSNYNSALGTGEDVAFCTRAMQAGHQPFVDLGLVCGHLGNHIYGPKRI